MASPNMNKGRGGRRSGAGRPAGSRNKITLVRAADAKTLTDLAREKTEAALCALESIMNNVEAPASARVSAATVLLDRAWGRPAQRVELDEDPGSNPAEKVPVRLIGPCDDDFEPLD